MKIGELSKRTGVSLRSLRYYEKQGLITASRLANGYREYNPLAVGQIETIRFYLDMGLTTEQIAGFLQCVLKNKESFCSEIMPIYEQKLDEIEKQLTLLTTIKSNLKERMESIRLETQQAEAAIAAQKTAGKGIQHP